MLNKDFAYTVSNTWEKGWGFPLSIALSIPRLSLITAVNYSSANAIVTDMMFVPLCSHKSYREDLNEKDVF